MNEVDARPQWWPDLEVDAPPYQRNPSAWSQRVPIAVLATVAGLISAYLALYQYRIIDGVWDPFFGAGSMNVLDSDASKTMHGWFGMHDTALGAIAYFGDAIWGMAGSTRRWQYRPWLVVLFGLDVIPLGIVSAILVFTQGAVVGSWCTLCLVTAVISLVLVYFAYDEVWASLKYLWRVWKRTHDKKVVWDTFWGKPSDVAAAVAREV